MPMELKEIVDQFSNYLQVEKGYSSNTVLAYMKDIDRFLDFLFSEFNINGITVVKLTHIRMFLVNIKTQGYQAKSINRSISSIRTFFKFCLKKKYITKNIASKIQMLKVPGRVHQAIKPKEIQKLFDRDFDNLDFFQYRAFLINSMIYCTGVRKQELIDIKLSDLNFPKAQVLITGKGNKQRLIPVKTELIVYLENYIELRSKQFQRPGPFLFLSNTGKKLSPRFVYNVVNTELSKITTVHKKSPHLLRHSLATHLLDNGASITAIKEILGHSSLAATQIYTDVSIGKLQGEYGKAFNRKPKRNS